MRIHQTEHHTYLCGTNSILKLNMCKRHVLSCRRLWPNRWKENSYNRFKSSTYILTCIYTYTHVDAVSLYFTLFWNCILIIIIKRLNSLEDVRRTCLIPSNVAPLILYLYGDFVFIAYSFIPDTVLVVIVFVSMVGVKKAKTLELSYNVWKLNWSCTELHSCNKLSHSF